MRLHSLNKEQALVHFILFTVAYFILGKICLTFGISYGNVSPIWLSSGIAAAAVLIWRYQVIPGIWLGTFLAVLTTEVSGITALFLGLGNCAEALVFFYLVRIYQNEAVSFDNPSRTFRFCVISACCCLSAALIGVGTLWFQGYIPLDAVPLNLFTWWLGDLSGILLLTPLILSYPHISKPVLAWKEWAEYLVYYLILIPASYLMFHGTTPYLFLIFIIYAVFRFSLLHVILTLLIGDLIALSMGMVETGAFVAVTGIGNLLSIQLFILTTSIVALFLNSVVQGWHLALRDLQNLTTTLQESIQEQTGKLRESEVRFHELFSNMHSGVVIYQAIHDGGDFIISDLNHAAEQIEGVIKDNIIGRSVLEVFPGVKYFGLFGVFQEVWKTGIPQQYPVSFYLDSERSGWRDNYVYKIPNGEVIAIYDDVTEQKIAEEKLKSAHEWLQFTLHAANAGSFDWNITEDTFNISDEIYALYGLPSSPGLSFETWLALLHPDDQDSVEKKVNQVIEEGGDLWIEFRIRLPDGTYRWIGSIGKTEYEEGKPVRLSGICLDISRKKEIEEALIKSEERLNYTLEAINDGYWDWDIPSGTTFFNPRWYTMLGYEPYEMPESYDTFLSLIHPDDRDRVLLEISDHFNHGTKPYAIEVRIKTKSGDYIWILTRGKVVIRDAEQKPVRMVGTHTDNTHRKKVEEALRESEERYRSLIDNVPDIILVHRDGIIQYVNPAAVLIMGYTREELLNTPLPLYIAPEYVKTVMTAVQKRMQGADIEPYEIDILMKSGERRTVVVRGSQIRYAGAPASLNVLTDITERKKIENQLRDFNEKLEEEVKIRTEELNNSLREKEVLLKEIHHRVKNNMQVVSSLLFMQARRTDSQEIRDILLESQNRIKSIALVHERLYQSRDFEKINYTEYLKRIAHDIFESYLVDPSRIQLEIRSDEIFMTIEKAVPCSLVVNELISNSLKYGFPEGMSGFIRITLSLDDRYTLIYEDNGVGIPEADSFENTRTLGFQLIKGLIRQIEGMVSLDQTEGTRFSITFPP